MARKSSPQLPVHRIIMVGPGGVGKSALTLQFVGEKFSEDYDPTRADSYEMARELDGHMCKINILDTAGQEEYAAIRDNYYRSGQGFLCVFSVNERESFDHLLEFRDQILRVLDDETVPFILAGNKCDLPQAPGIIEDAHKRAKEWNCDFVETSAKLNTNVTYVYEALARKIRNRKAEVEERERRKAKKKCIIS